MRGAEREHSLGQGRPRHLIAGEQALAQPVLMSDPLVEPEQVGTDEGVQATEILALLPPVIVVAAMQRQFVKGLFEVEK